MANHVTSTMWIVEGNEAAFEAMKAISERASKVENAFELWEDTQAMFDNDEYLQIGDEIGCKWSNVFDWDEEQISFESAWGYPAGAHMRVAKEVWEADPKAILAMTYEDEMPNFIGSAVYAGGDMWDEEYIDSDNYEALGLKYWWDEDEDGPEPEDWEPTYEEGANIRDNDVDTMVESYKEYLAEQDGQENWIV